MAHMTCATPTFPQGCDDSDEAEGMDETAAGFYCNSEGYLNETAPPVEGFPRGDEAAPPTVDGAGIEGAALEGENLVALPRKV